jgi:CheY-like chemotaxis protein
MSRTILLADDSVTIQKVVELTFLDEGYKVVAVGNGADAAARLDEVRPDLVIADVHMPGLNGYDVAKRAKQWRAGMPVLLLVGTFEPFDKAHFADSGADAVLKKPFDSQELLRQAQELLSSAPAAAEPALEAAPEWSLADMATEETPSASATQALPSARPAVTAYQPPAAAPAPIPAPAPAPAPAATSGPLSDADVERIARRVAELISERIVREVSWEVIPDLAEVIIKDRIRELESQVE